MDGDGTLNVTAQLMYKLYESFILKKKNKKGCPTLVRIWTLALYKHTVLSVGQNI